MKRFLGVMLRVALVAVIGLAAIPATAAPVATRAADARADDVVIYDDGLSAGWDNWSWDTTANLGAGTPARGSASIGVKYNAAWAGFSLRINAPLNTSSYSALSFWAYGAAGGTPLQFFSQSSDGGGNSSQVDLDVPANTWQQFTVTLAALGSPATLARLNWQDRTGAVQPMFYLDDIRLVSSSGTPPPTSTSTPPPSASTLTADIRVQAGAPGTAISPMALGSNLPSWVSSKRMKDEVLRARAVASGAQVMRIPGGSWSDDYRWLQCEMLNPEPMNCTDEDGASRPTDFINFLRATHRTPMYTMNINVTSKEAAAAVAFFNSAVTDTTSIGVDIRGTDWYTAGHWSQLRAAHGNLEPFKIAYWEFGNEIYGGKSGPKNCVDFGWESTWTCDGTEYVNGMGAGASRHEGYLEFRAAMKAVDPAIVLGAVGTDDPVAWSNWTNEVIAAAGKQLDFLVVHPYAFFILPKDKNGKDELAEILAKPQNHLGPIKQSLQAALGTNPAPIALTEFNVTSSQDQDNGQLMTRQVNALFMADSIGQALQNNYLTVLQWAFVNGKAGNGTDYGLLQVDTSWFRAPAYYVYPLWARFGSTVLPVTTTMSAASQLSVYAGRIDGNTISLLAVNKTNSAITGTISLDDVTQIASGLADVVAPAGNPASLMAQSATFNGNANPANDLADAPSTVLGAGTGGATQYVFAPYSVTLLRLKTSAVASPNTPTPTATLQGGVTATPSATATQTLTPRPTFTPDPRLKLRTWMPLLMRH